MINFLKKLYAKLWVPFFGRILFKFVYLIEGKEPKDKPTYDIDKTNN